MSNDFLDDIVNAAQKIQKMNKPLKYFITTEHLELYTKRFFEESPVDVVVAKHYLHAERGVKRNE